MARVPGQKIARLTIGFKGALCMYVSFTHTYVLEKHGALQLSWLNLGDAPKFALEGFGPSYLERGDSRSLLHLASRDMGFPKLVGAQHIESPICYDPH